MSHFPEPTHLLCLTCGSLNERSTQSIAQVCRECDGSLEPEQLLRLYEYAAEVYYYGRQYRVYYERAYEHGDNPPKPHLGFDGEAFAWAMLAALSGVLGNASYDAIKAVISKVRADISSGRVVSKDYTPLLELTDAQLGELMDAARTYCNGMDGLTKEVQAAIIEEIVANTVTHDPALAEEMAKLMERKNIKPKHRKRFVELLRNALVRPKYRNKPQSGAFNDLWSKLSK